MLTPSPTLGSSHSAAAAALLELSQSPPNPAFLHKGTITPRNSEQRSPDVRSSVTVFSRDGDSIMRTSGTLKSDVHIFSSPWSGVFNGDFGDMDMQAHEVHRDDSIDAPQANYAMLRVAERRPQAPPVMPLIEDPVPTFASDLAIMKRSNTAPSHSSPCTAIEGACNMSVVDHAFAQPSDGLSQLSAQLPQTPHPILTLGPDELESYLHHNATFSHQEYGASLRPAPTPSHLPDHSSQQTESEPLGPHEAMMMGQRGISQPSLLTQCMLSPVSSDLRTAQQAPQHTSSAEEPHGPPSTYVKPSPGRNFAGSRQGRAKTQMSRAPSRAKPKRLKAHTKSQAEATRRDGFGPKQIDVRDLKYRTIMVINMPARTDVTPGQPPPEPTPDSQPYGEDADYRASILIWLCDDLELSYSEAVRRYRLKFSDERSITEDTLRKRHILLIEKLARRYGLKPEDELEEPSGRVAIRGKQSGHKYNTINGIRVYSAAAGHDVAGTVRSRRTGNKPTAHKGFLKACICVWKDSSNVSNEEIKLRLQKDYGWNIGSNTVNKLYYKERARVYDTYNEGDTSDQEACTNTADEDLDHLQAHFQQRLAYLLKTHGQELPAQDAAYMQNLQQLIDSLQTARLQRAHVGSGPIRMFEDAVKEASDAGETEMAEEGDVTMHDAEPGVISNKGND